MNCPFCGSPMEKGRLALDGRMEPRWISDGEKPSRTAWLFGTEGRRVLGLPRRGAFDTRLLVDTEYCGACEKFIFSGKVSRW